jgi:uncharacterized protein HemX
MVDNVQEVVDRSMREIAGLRRVMVVVLIVAVGTASVAFWQVQELRRVRSQVSRLQTALTAEADRRLQSMLPDLEARAQRIEASAERADRAVQSLDAKLDAAGDRIAQRAVQQFQQDLPEFLDSYLRSRVPR